MERINSTNARRWAAILNTIEVINGLKTIKDFYGSVEPFAVLEVYNRLQGWRKEAYQNFLLSGSLVVQPGSDVFNWGKYVPGKQTMEVLFRDEYGRELKGETWSWEKLCEYFN